jgi:DNA polymerase-3 subunit delta
MYKNEFDSLKELPHFLVFYGNSFFLDIYQKKIEEKFKDKNILKFYFDEFKKDIVKTYLMENSLFSSGNVLIIKTDKFNKDLEDLKKYAKDSYCFIFYTGNKKINLNKNEFVRFFEPSFKEIVEYIDTLSLKESVTFSSEAKIFLAKSIEPAFLENEIKKLANFKKEISVKDIKEVVFLYKEESFEELFVKILNNEDFFEDLQKLLKIVDFKRVIPSFIKYLNMLYKFYLYIKVNGSFDSKTLLGYKLPKHIEEERVKLAMQLKEEDYKNLLDYLLNKELLMRNSEKEKEAIFWESMIFLRNYRSF